MLIVLYVVIWEQSDINSAHFTIDDWQTAYYAVYVFKCCVFLKWDTGRSWNMLGRCDKYWRNLLVLNLFMCGTGMQDVKFSVLTGSHRLYETN
jgi:hypothetical protein